AETPGGRSSRPTSIGPVIPTLDTATSRSTGSPLRTVNDFGAFTQIPGTGGAAGRGCGSLDRPTELSPLPRGSWRGSLPVATEPDRNPPRSPLREGGRRNCSTLSGRATGGSGTAARSTSGRAGTCSSVFAFSGRTSALTSRGGGLGGLLPSTG